tara:strand:+ start:2647 stop:3042 length:396 start_codon:yes stop_codon:yes gene_type:complete
MKNYFNNEEIEQHFKDFWFWSENYSMANDYDDLNELTCAVHHECFNTDYYIIGTYQAKQWLGDNAFDAIEIIKSYEQDNFGEVFTDLSDPEKVVNMYTFIVGEEIVHKFFDSFSNINEVQKYFKLTNISSN